MLESLWRQKHERESYLNFDALQEQYSASKILVVCQEKNLKLIIRSFMSQA